MCLVIIIHYNTLLAFFINIDVNLCCYKQCRILENLEKYKCNLIKSLKNFLYLSLIKLNYKFLIVMKF